MSDQVATELQNIHDQVEKLVASLKKSRPKRGPAQDTRSTIDPILRHMEAHGDYLWSHAIRLPKEAGGGVCLVERTNNILDGFFHGMKHDERRRRGRKILTQDFEHLPRRSSVGLQSEMYGLCLHRLRFSGPPSGSFRQN